MSGPLDDFAAELAGLDGGPPPGEVVVAGTGTIAPKAVASPALHRSMAAAGVDSAAGTAHPDLGALLADPVWRLALVLSPHKTAAAAVAGLTPTAKETGVVDTLLRSGDRTVGINTNTFAAGHALAEAACGRSKPTVLVVGTGASARSVLTAAGRWLPDALVVLTGRRHGAVAALAEATGAGIWAGDAAADVVVNATTWGETAESEAAPYPVDLAEVLAPGGRLFDLNNRVGALMTTALGLGAMVVPGLVMQHAVHRLRAAVAAGA